MIGAVLVDDEILALERLERMLLRQEGIEVVGMFTSPRQAVERIPGLNPDVVFLDIEMPGLNGLEAAEQILAINENIDVVFITAFDQYAVEAFELNAVDYLLKPVSEEVLQKTILTIRSRRGVVMDREETGKLKRILCFGKFEVTNVDFESLALNWRTAESRELFAYLLQYRGKPVAKDAIIEALWPEVPMERADSIFHATIFYLHKVLQDDLQLCTLQYTKDNSYVLVMRVMYYDVDYFERMITPGRRVRADRVANLEKAVQVYRGDYMEEEQFSWADGERNRLLFLYIDALKQLSKHWIELKDYSAAEVFLRKWLIKEPLADEPRSLMMEVYAHTGRQAPKN